MNRVRFSPDYYPNSTTGRALSGAKIYVGNPDTDPTVPANQKTLSVLQEDGSTVSVTQPLYTNAGGVPIYNGSPVTMMVDGNYSLKVLSSKDVQLYYIPSNISAEYKVQYSDNVAAMKADTTWKIGDIVQTISYYPGARGGGGLYVVEADGGVYDEGSIIKLTGTGLQARLLLDSFEVEAAKFGTKEDDVSFDNGPPINKAYLFAKTLNDTGETYDHSGAYSVKLPPGKLFFTTQINFTQSGYSDPDVTGYGRFATLLIKSTDMDGIYIYSSGARFSDFGLTKKAGLSDTGDGINIFLGSRIDMRNIYVANQGGNGIRHRAGNLASFSNIKLSANGANGFLFEEYTGEVGISARACSFRDFDCITNTGNGFYLKAGLAETLVNVVCQQNGADGLRIDTNNVMGTTYCEANGTVSGYDIHFGAGSINNHISSVYHGSLKEDGTNNSIVSCTLDQTYAITEDVSLHDPYMTPPPNLSGYGYTFRATGLEAGSGTHDTFASVKVDTVTRAAGAASLNYLINLLIEAQGSGASLGTYSMWVKGRSRFDSLLELAVDDVSGLSGTVSDYDFSGKPVIRMAYASAGNLSGLLAFTSNAIVEIINVGSYNISVLNEDSGSAAANRILTQTGGTVVIAPGYNARFFYDAITARWRMLG